MHHSSDILKEQHVKSLSFITYIKNVPWEHIIGNPSKVAKVRVRYFCNHLNENSWINCYCYDILRIVIVSIFIISILEMNMSFCVFMWTKLYTRSDDRCENQQYSLSEKGVVLQGVTWVYLKKAWKRILVTNDSNKIIYFFTTNLFTNQKCKSFDHVGYTSIFH